MGTEEKTKEAEEAAETTESIKTMKSIYIEKNESIAYFIGSFKEDDEEFVEIGGNAAIAKFAFAHSGFEQILFKGCPSSIGESAFEGCESLVTVIFGKVGTDKMPTGNEKTNPANCEMKIGKSVLKNLALTTAADDFTIQANAFNGCGSLTTLVLPEVNGTLTIEKDAFCGCGALRTVVALCDTIDFTGNPFAEEAEHLTFICKKDSGVARFARENGYRSVYVG